MSKILQSQRIEILRKIMGINSNDVDTMSEAEGCVEEPLPDLESYDAEYCFNEFCDSLHRYYPSYIRYHQEQDWKERYSL